MPFAFGHILGAWVPGKIWERFKKIDRLAWGALLLGAILPDGDFLLEWTIGIEWHRTVTHSIFFAVLMGIVTYYIAKYFKLNAKQIGFAIFAGIMIHIILDAIGYPGINILWPTDWWFYWPYFYKCGVPLYDRFVREPFSNMRFAILDMGLGVLWIGYLFAKGKLEF